MKYILFLIPFVLLPTLVNAQTVDLSQLTAQGVAIYGWHNGVATILYQTKQTTLFPVASITKLITAKAVETLYPENKLFTVSKIAMTNDEDSNDGIVPGMTFTRDDLLRALLISSNNGAGKEFDESSAPGVFLTAMNTFLHTNGYTVTNFVNATGLDPASSRIAPNRLTPKSLSYLLADIYQHDPLLTSILEQKSATATDQTSGMTIQFRSSDELNYDPMYSPLVILSKTGTTNLAGQNIAFITNGGSMYDYVTVVFMHSKNRYQDGKLILDWLQQIFHYVAS